MAANSSWNFPDDQVEEILLRLPATDLLRLKEVCKSWKTLIENLDFISKHHRNFPPKFLFITAYVPRFSLLNLISLSSLNSPFPSNITHHLQHALLTHYPTPRRTHLIRSIRVADGLVFVKLDSMYGLWNPLTRTFKKITPPPNLSVPELHGIRIGPHDRRTNQVSGFGFDPVSEDYKYVSCDFMTDSINEQSLGLVRIYSKRSDSWEKFAIHLPQIQGANITDGYLLGSYYWFGLEQKENGSMVPSIISFNFSTKVLEVTPLPMEFVNLKYGGVMIRDKQSLGLVVVLGDGLVEAPRCEMWVNGSGSGIWTRTMSFGLNPEIERPKGYWDGEMVFETRMDRRGVRELVFCNRITGICKEVKIRGSNFCLFNYVESLLPVSN